MKNFNQCTTKVTCVLEALTTWGEIPEEVTVPVGGRFLLVTDAHEKACMWDIIMHH